MKRFIPLLRTWAAEDLERTAIIIMDPEFVVRAWIRGARRIFRWTAEEAVGRHSYELYAPHDDERARRIDALRTEGTWRGAGVWRTKGGALVALEGQTIVMRSSAGRASGIITVVRELPAEPGRNGRPASLEKIERFLSQIASVWDSCGGADPRRGTYVTAPHSGECGGVAVVTDPNRRLTIGRNIRRARVAADLSQREFALLLGVGRSRVYEWETGRHVPSDTHLEAIATVTGKRGIGWAFDEAEEGAE